MALSQIVKSAFVVLLLMPLIPAFAVEDEYRLLPYDLPAVAEEDLHAVLAIHNPSWISQRLTNGTTSAGFAHQFFNSLLAQSLYYSRKLDGVDMQRPAWFFWRGPQKRMSAVIPILSRSEFEENFGDLPMKSTVMVRVGEREGTAVYSLNTDDGLIEYRVLIRDNTAFVGSSAFECQQLAAHDWRIKDLETFDPLYFITTSHQWFTVEEEKSSGENDDENNSDVDNAGMFGAVGNVANIFGNFFAREWNALVSQIELLRLSVRPIGDFGGMGLQIGLKAQPETGLAYWIVRQQNQSSRILAALLDNDTAVSFHGGFNFGGEFADFGNRAIEALSNSDIAASLPVGWRDAMGAWFNLVDRRGPFAYTVSVEPREGLPALYEHRMISEQARSSDVLTVQQELEQIFTEQAMPAVKREQGQRLSRGYPVFWSRLDMEPPYNQVHLAGEEHLIHLAGERDITQLEKTGLAYIDALRESRVPIGSEAVWAFSLRVDLMLESLAKHLMIGHAPFEPTSFEVTMRREGDSELVFGIDLPITQISDAVRASGLGSWIESQNIGLSK